MDFTHDALRKHTTARRTIFFVRMDRGKEKALFKTCCTTSSTKNATVSGCARSCTMREKLSAKNGESLRQSKFQHSLEPSTLCSMLRSSFSQISFRWGCNAERDCMII